MIQILKIIILKLFSILPDSPFSNVFDDMDASFFYYMNWFLPVDICSNIMLTWLTAITFCYVFLFAKFILKNVVQTVMKGISVAGMFGGGAVG